MIKVYTYYMSDWNLNSISYVGVDYIWATFGELAGTNIKIDLTLRKYMYNALYINQHAIQVQY